MYTSAISVECIQYGMKHVLSKISHLCKLLFAQELNNRQIFLSKGYFISDEIIPSIPYLYNQD